MDPAGHASGIVVNPALRYNNATEAAVKGGIAPASFAKSKDLAANRYGMDLRTVMRHENMHGLQLNLDPRKFRLWNFGKARPQHALYSTPGQWRMVGAETQARMVEPGSGFIDGIRRMSYDAPEYLRMYRANAQARGIPFGAAQALPWRVAEYAPGAVRNAAIGIGGLGAGYGISKLPESGRR